MSGKAEIDVIRRVFVPHSADMYLEIRPWPESPNDCLELHVTDECKDYFGPLRLSLDLVFAEALAKALLASAEELRSKASE